MMVIMLEHVLRKTNEKGSEIYEEMFKLSHIKINRN